MMVSQHIFKFSVFFGVVIVCLTIFFGYLFFEPFITETEITIKVVNKEKFGGTDNKYFIFTENEVFLNEDNYYHGKENADEIYPVFKKGGTYRVTVVGIYMTWIPRFRNILEVEDNFSKINKDLR